MKEWNLPKVNRYMFHIFSCKKGELFVEMLSVQNLEKSYGSFKAVKGITFTVQKGESFGLLGPNGAGKSTTINMISGLFHPSAGSIKIGEIDMVKDTKRAQALIGVVPQDIALYQTMTAMENLLFWGRMYGLSGNELKKRVDEVLEIVGLKDRAKERVETFSGGMKRRINIGAAILHRPELLIMDEPTVGIDPQSRNHILETVKELNREGMTIIYTSHYMEEVEYLCTRIGIIDHGQFIACGTVAELREMIGNRSRIVLKITSSQVHEERLKNELNQLFDGSGADVTVQKDEITVFHKEPQLILGSLIQAVSRYGVSVSSVDIIEPNLESLFLHLTGRSLRE